MTGNKSGFPNAVEDGARARPIIDHVGIAVNSLAPASARWAALLGRAPTGEETIEAEGVRVAFFGEGAGRIELIAPLDAASPIMKFLERRGPGIHHVCARASDLDAALRDAEAAGAEVIEPRIRTGAGGTRVAFLHPRANDGVLLELREEPDTP
ncbi:MAG: methylmalonyl-CoA epimerase [Gemmatimonadetes bacterium]|nr:methylmalonyl-CoA epimerase [Gemmatimonadota bacterium]